MRAAERLLGRNSALLMTSSPAFIREYFEPFRQLRAPVALLENKVLELAGERPPTACNWPRRRPTASLGRSAGSAPCAAASRWSCSPNSRAPMDGRFEIVLRGRPAYSEFDDFDGFVAAEPYMTFDGAYRNPEDLAAIYGEVHFSWAIDFFEEGLNSSWLLPNRLYEGCRYGAVPIAMSGTETARFLAERHIGLLLDEPSPDALAALLGGHRRRATTPTRARRSWPQDRGTWVCDLGDCRGWSTGLQALRANAARPH